MNEPTLLLEDDDETIKYNQYPMTNETKTLLHNILSTHFLFDSLNIDDINKIITVMKKEVVQTGVNIITQGEQGQELYILEEGTFDIIVDDQKVGDYQGGSSFGELALMFKSERAATIKATSECTLWSLELNIFRRILATTSSSIMVQRCEFLKSCPLLQPLSNDQITKLAGALTPEEFEPDSYIVKQGEVGDTFYIIEEGEVEVTHTSDLTNAESHLLDLKQGDYFGEMALMLDEPRHANCISRNNKVKCLTLSQEHFINLLGPLQNVLAQQMRIRILKSCPLLANLTDDDLNRVANVMRVQLFDDGQYIIRQGEEGSRFYIINEGEVICTQNNESGGETELLRLGNQEYFGERALLKREPRKANIIASGPVECLVLERSDFDALLGSLQDIMDNEMKRREELVEKNKKGIEISTRRSSAISKIPVGPKTNFKLEDLNQLRTVGTGTFGRVKIVQHKGTGKVAALKAMAKSQIVSSHQERNIMNEKNILMECKHPFILELLQTYNTPNQLFMLMEMVQGGELWSYIYEKYDCIPRTPLGGFTAEAAKFYTGCVVSAFGYIHDMGVAYRDLKPENLLLNHQGYLKIIDFGFAKPIPFTKNNAVHQKSFTLCGTPEYLAPELVLSKGHGKGVDYWALGCLVYELLIGHTPFCDDSQSEIFKKIIHSERALSFPRNFWPEIADLIRKLLTPNPSFRLGNLSHGINDIKNHEWFLSTGFDWVAFENFEIQAPYVPIINDPLDTSNFDPYPEDDYVPRYVGPQNIFEGF